jgi:alpha-tubulin suppressor-like RCC1 family protein
MITAFLTTGRCTKLAACVFLLLCEASAQSSIRGWGGPGFDTRAFDRRCVQVAAAGQRTAYLRADGQIFVHGAAGFYYYMDWNVPPPPPGRAYIDIGLSYGCIGLLSDGSVVHWANQGLLYTPPAPPPGMWYTEMDSSGLMLERIDGAIVYWGPNTYGQANFPPLPPGLSIVKFGTSGTGHCAFLLSDGSLLMWGNNANGQCSVPGLPLGVTYVDFAFGHTHTLALRSDGWIEAFGGTGWAPLLIVPPLPAGTTYTMCAGGQDHSVAVRSDNVLVAWGGNTEGQCDVPTLPAGVRCVQLDCGQLHTVARLSDGSTRSWGSGTWFECALPVLPGSPVTQRGTFVDLSIGRYGAVVISSDGTADAFSWNVTLPPLPAGTRYVRSDASVHTLLLRSDGQIVGSGPNIYGELNAPPLPAGMTWVDFALASQFSVAIRSDGQAFSFGNVGPSGVIPVLPPGVSYVDVDCSPGKAILLRSDGQVVLIGSPSSGIQPAPVPPAGLHYESIAANDGNNVAVRSDGEAVLWGWQGMAPQFVPPPALPFGVSYVEAVGGNLQFALRRSDGEIVMCGNVGGFSFGWLSVVPALEPGTSYLQVSASAENTAARVGPTRTYVSFAPGCAGSRPATRLIPRDTPFVGGTHRVTLFDLPANVALLAMGFQRTTPLALGVLGMPGCDWHVSLDAITLLSGQGNQAVWELPIPDMPSLVGVRFYNQALVLDPAAGNAFGAVISNAAEGVIGYR